MQDAGRADPADRRIAGVLVAVHLVVAALALITLGSEVRDDDVLRFHDVASEPGAPWRDHEVEYAPGQVLLLEAIAGQDPTGTGRGLVAITLLADLALMAMIAQGWGAGTAKRYLLAAMPILPFIFLRFDLVPAALAMGALWLTRRGRERSGGVMLAAAILTKLWPAALIPALLVSGRRRAFGWACVTTALGMGAWVGYAGTDGLRQVVSFRGATGWGIGSVVGVLVWILAGGPPRIEQGAPRVGSIPGWARSASAAALVAGLAATWWRARRWDGDVAGAPALVAVAVVMSASPLLSMQYAAWLLPFAAVASVEHRSRWAWRLAAACIALSGLVFAVGDLSSVAGPEQAAILVRNLALLAIPVWWFRATRQRVSITG